MMTKKKEITPPTAMTPNEIKLFTIACRESVWHAAHFSADGKANMKHVVDHICRQIYPDINVSAEVRKSVAQLLGTEFHRVAKQPGKKGK